MNLSKRPEIDRFLKSPDAAIREYVLDRPHSATIYGLVASMQAGEPAKAVERWESLRLLITGDLAAVQAALLPEVDCDIDELMKLRETVNASAAMVFSFFVAVILAPWLMIRFAKKALAPNGHGGHDGPFED